MLHAGLDLSRRWLDVCLVDDAGELVEHTAAPPDADGLWHLAERLRGQQVLSAVGADGRSVRVRSDSNTVSPRPL